MQDIETLLNKYWDGETTLEEERSLKAYFAQPGIDEKWRPVAPLFQAIREEQAQQMPHRNGGTRVVAGNFSPRLRWAAAAALIGMLALAGTWAVRNQQEEQRIAANKARLQEDTFEDPQQAAAEIKAALALVSSKMRKGKKNAAKGLKKMEKVEKYFPKAD